MPEFTSKRIGGVIVIREKGELHLIKKDGKSVAVVYSPIDLDFLLWCLNNRDTTERFKAGDFTTIRMA